MVVGIGPVSSLLPHCLRAPDWRQSNRLQLRWTYILIKCPNDPTSVGIEPPILFASRKTLRSSVRRPTSVGTVPFKALMSSCSAVSAESKPIVVGIVPLIEFRVSFLVEQTSVDDKTRQAQRFAQKSEAREQADVCRNRSIQICIRQVAVGGVVKGECRVFRAQEKKN